MGERERQHTTLRSVGRGLRTGALLFAFVGGGGLVYRALFGPVLRDLARGVPLPGNGPIFAAAAVVGAIGFWFGLRGGRAYVAVGGAVEGRRGERALAIARANARERERLRAAHGGSGVARAVHVQRWDSALLTGGDLHEIPEGVTSHADADQ